MDLDVALSSLQVAFHGFNVTLLGFSESCQHLHTASAN
jgi:hypothetical protein